MIGSFVPRGLLSALLAGVAIALVPGGAPPRAAALSPNGSGDCWVYLASSSEEFPEQDGIHILQWDHAAGKLTPVGRAGGVVRPIYLALHPSGRFLYAVGNPLDVGDGDGAGVIAAYAINPEDGSLRLLNVESTRGAVPCHLVVDPAGRAVLVANYTSGNVASLPLGADGSLRPAQSVFLHQAATGQKAHAHSINLSPGNRFACAGETGLDQLRLYRFDPAAATLAPHDPAWTPTDPRSGPRHAVFHPQLPYFYVIHETNCTVSAYRFHEDRGTLELLQTLPTLPVPFQNGFSTAELLLHPGGRFLYGSNRGHDTIAILAIDPETGRLTAVGHEPTRGKTPRNFGIDPRGEYLVALNQESHTVVTFRIDSQTGALTATGESLELTGPMCIKFVPREGR
jgi:6-phosphogluconolactonase